MDNLIFGPSVPRTASGSISTAIVSFVDIPKADPVDVSILNIAEGTIEDSQDRGVAIVYSAPGPATLTRLAASGVGFGQDLGLAGPAGSGYPTFCTFQLDGPSSYFQTESTTQTAASVPIQITGIVQDDAGAWRPKISRGVFYRVFQLDDYSSSWIIEAGFQNGQMILASYTTELDSMINQGGGYGIGYSGGLINQKVLTPISDASNANTISLGSDPIVSVGGITTDTGLELLTEKGVSTVAPGAGTVNQLTVQVFNAIQSSNTIDGRIRSSVPFETTTLGATVSGDSSSSWSDRASNYGTFSANPPAMENATIMYSGSFFVAASGYYSFNVTYYGKLRIHHWGVPVVDRWYGAFDTTQPERYATYSGYFHAGWHDISLEWAPQPAKYYSYTDATIQVQFNATGLTWSTEATTKSEVDSINISTGDVTFKGNYVGTGLIRATYACTSNDLIYTGWFYNSTFFDIDLNPSYGRTCYNGTLSNQNWPYYYAWLYMIPSTVCALTASDGVTPITTNPVWVSAASATGFAGTIRWGLYSNGSYIEPYVGSAGPTFGSVSAFGSEVVGETPYSSIGDTYGVVSPGNGTLDFRGAYNSGFIIGQLNLNSSVPGINNATCFDIRSRGGGLDPTVDTNTLTSGPAQEQAQTFWDVSSFDGPYSNPNGVALVQIPSSILSGSDGQPAFSADEIESIVRSTLSAGIHPIIQFV